MISRVCRDNLRAIVAAFRQATGLTVTQVSRKFYGNTNFLTAYFAGRQSMSVDKFDQVLAGLQAEWPENAEWPTTRAAVIPRPKR